MSLPPRSPQTPAPERGEPRELAALTALADAQPDLAPAIALERELLDGERRLQRRLGTLWLDMPAELLAERLAAGEPLMRWDQLAIDWPECRLRWRQVVDVLRRHDVLDAHDAARLLDLARDASLPDLASRWYSRQAPGDDIVGLADVAGLTLRPFLARAAEVLQRRVSTDTWARGTCPMCGGDPVFAVLPPGGGRQLVCGRCLARWAFDPRKCPHCLADDGQRVFSALDGMYQVAACNHCRRYLKALDVRRAGRPLLLALDVVTTLPIDQAIGAQGYAGD